MIDDATLAHWRKLADDTPPDWTAPLKDLGAIPSFQAVDFYFDNSYEVYPPLGYCGPLLVAASEEVAEFATAARTAVPALLDEVDSLRARVTALEAELDAWRNWHPDDETLADAQRKAFKPNGDHGGSLAAMVVYVRVLEERIRRHDASDMENVQIREVMDSLRNYVAHYPECPKAKFTGDCSCGLHNYLSRYAALAASPAPETKQGEREAEKLVLRLALEWYDSHGLHWKDKLWEAIAALAEVETHTKRAKALRAQAGGEG